MSTLSLSTSASIPSDAELSRRRSIPKILPIVVFSALCILVGIVWDISWHETIGRDSFWTPAHMVIYLGGTLGGMCSGWQVFQSTFFGSPADRENTVGFWGLRGPFGAWVSIWGAIAMLTSAPLDNWWHDAYGLDVKILSPPHSLLAAGMWTVVLGSLLQVLSWRHRGENAPILAGKNLYFVAAGIWLSLATIMFTEYSWPNHQHTASYYRISCRVYAFLLIALARGAGVRWGATAIAGIYLVTMAGLSWALTLIPATPKLGPIYNPVTHMVPQPFPHLLIFPAMAIDLWLWASRKLNWKHDFWLGPAIGISFVLVFLPVQWHFAKFILSPAADNGFFLGNRYWTYFSSRNDSWGQFWHLDNDGLTTTRVLAIFVVAMIASTCGLFLGRWMARIRR